MLLSPNVWGMMLWKGYISYGKVHSDGGLPRNQKPRINIISLMHLKVRKVDILKFCVCVNPADLRFGASPNGTVEEGEETMARDSFFFLQYFSTRVRDIVLANVKQQVPGP